MIDQLFLQINIALTGAGGLAFAAAFTWGVCSVIFSPCHLASIPLVIAYIGGFTEDKKIKHAFWYSLLFSIGLFISIAVIGVITSLAGKMLGASGGFGSIIIGIVFLLVGVHLLGFLPINIPGLDKLQTSRKGAIGALLLGLSYGIVSGPCTFGFIAPMLAMVALQSTATRGIILILIFALGHCIPILIGGSATSLVKKVINSNRIQGSGVWFKRLAGVTFILVAVYLIISMV
jgi:cytochrome c-type biogenesis protein